MGKLMKYELKGLSKFIIGVLVILLIASFVLQYNLFSTLEDSGFNDGYMEFDENNMSVLKPLLMGLSGMVLWGSYLVSFFYIVNSFNKEITEDKGYLTFTLPVTGNQIVGAKLVSAMIYFIALIGGVVLFNMLIALFFTRNMNIPIKEFIEMVMMNFGWEGFRTLVYFIIYGLISTGYMITLIYFSMALRKIIFGGKRMNGMWFIMYLVMSAVLGYIFLRISFNIPYYLDITNMKFTTLEGGLNGLMMQAEYGYPGFTVNIAQFIMQLLAFVGFYLGTGYLLENKIEM